VATSGRAVAAALTGAALFGTAGTAAVLFTRAEPDAAAIPSLALGAARLGVGGLALFVAGVVVHRGIGPFARVARSRVGLLAAGCVALYQVCFFGGVRTAGVAVATLVAVGSAPVCTGLLAWAVLRERATRSWAAATAVCVAGLALATAAAGATSDRAWVGAGVGAGAVLGAVLALGAGVAIAGYTVCAKHLLTQGADGLPFMATTYLLAWLVLAPFVVAGPTAWLSRPGGLAVAAYLGLATMSVANVVYLRGISHLAPGPVSTLGLADPVVATVLGVVVLGERPALGAWLGFALVAAGLVWQAAAAARGAVSTPPEPVTPL
jgi:DME family drug/metabolite transporter